MLSALRNTAFWERLSAYRRRRPTTYSQYAEDAYVSSYYADLDYAGVSVSGGLFVDIGAYRPIHISNSYSFHKRGWRCINIDATPGSMRMFDKVRPADINLEVAIGQTEGELRYFVFGEPSVFNTMDPVMARYHQETQSLPPPREIPIAVRRLDSVLAEHSGGLSFEVLNIDVEGFDVEVLKSNNWDLYAPRVILIESHGLTSQTLDACEAATFLKPMGYKIHAWMNPTVMFVKEQ